MPGCNCAIKETGWNIAITPGAILTLLALLAAPFFGPRLYKRIAHRHLLNKLLPPRDSQEYEKIIDWQNQGHKVLVMTYKEKDLKSQQIYVHAEYFPHKPPNDRDNIPSVATKAPINKIPSWIHGFIHESRGEIPDSKSGPSVQKRKSSKKFNINEIKIK